MNYIYNIHVNLKKNLINFYEWNKKDKITNLSKVKAFIVNYYDYDRILKMNIKVRKEFLDTIKIDNYICLFSNNIDIVCCLFDKDGTIKKISKLDLNEEDDVLAEIESKSKTKLLYGSTNKSNNYKLTTRNENEIIDKLLDYIKESKNNTELIDYLYYEWFHSSKSKDKYNELVKNINSEYSDKHNELFKIIELINS